MYKSISDKPIIRYLINSPKFLPFLISSVVQGSMLGVLPYLYIQIAFSMNLNNSHYELSDFFETLKSKSDILIYTAIATLITVVTYVIDLVFYDQSFLSVWKDIMVDALQETIYQSSVPSHERFYRMYTTGDSRLRNLFFGLRQFVNNLAATIVCLAFMCTINVKFTFLFLGVLIAANVGLAYLHAIVVEEFSVVKQDREAFIVHDMKQKARLMKLVKTAGKTDVELLQDTQILKNHFENEVAMSAKRPVYMNILFACNTHLLQSVIMALGVLYLQFTKQISPKDGIILFLYVSNLGRFFQDGSIGFGLAISSRKSCQSVIDEVFELYSENIETINNEILSHTPSIQEMEYFRSIGTSLGAIKEERESLVNLVNISKSFSGHLILKEISVHLSIGSKTAIVGVSGAGKSTLLDLMTGYQQPDLSFHRETILLQDVAYIPPLNQAELWKTNLHHNLCYSAKTEPNIDIILQVVKLLRLQKSSIDPPKPTLNNSQDYEIISTVNVDEEFLYAPFDPSTLSSGERQRILLGRALLSGRSVVVSDEGTSALDKQMEEQVLKIMDKTFFGGWIMVTHDWGVLKECDRALVLNRGRIEEAGDPNLMVMDKDSIVHLLFGKTAGVKKK